MDSDTYINSYPNNKIMSDEEKVKLDLKETENNIIELKKKIKEYKKLKWYYYIFIISLTISIARMAENFISWLIWTIFYTGIGISSIIIPKIKAYMIRQSLKEKLNELEENKTKLEKQLLEYEEENKKRQEKLKSDTESSSAKKQLLEKIDKLDKNELLAIKTVISEYTANKDVPSQVGNIAQFLTETQFGINIEETSLYNKQLDEEVKGHSRS